MIKLCALVFTSLLIVNCCKRLVQSANSRSFKAASDEGLVTVHVVPHSHDDVGWLKTMDQYYYGARGDIRTDGVQYILDTVVEELITDPTKTFIYVEIAFFKMWWEEQDKAMHTKVRDLIKRKQLEFVNGGFVSNDEAGVHYSATIDQFSAGLVWLTETFGGDAEPRVAWQVDPFGHSKAQVALSYQIGLKGMFFARVHYQDYERRKRDKELEFMWQAEGDSVFTGILYGASYLEPTGFCFDTRCTDSPMVTNPNSPEYNVPERVTQFVEYLKDHSAHYRSGHIMITMGRDFAYQNAHKYFKNLDILMNSVNANSTGHGFKMVYSTPSRYMDSVADSIGSTLSNKTDDHFPYADTPHAYWTGYYTSRPALKGYIRDSNNMLQTCRQIEVLVGSKRCDADSLWLALSVAQHHDAITGTSKQHVADDYARQLALGQTFCEGVINRGLEQLAGVSSKGVSGVFSGVSNAGVLQSCRLLNESVCHVSAESGNKSLTVVIYNARPVSRNEYIRIPLLHPHYKLIDLTTMEPVMISFVTTSPRSIRINPESLPIEGVFQATLPAMGFSSYRIVPSFSSSFSQILMSKPVMNDIKIESKALVVEFDGKTGSLKSITNKQSGVKDALGYKFMEYYSSVGDDVDKQASGAYIFRPQEDSAQDIAAPVLTNYLVGKRFSEVWQSFGDWATLVTRVYEDKDYVEVEWVVGPLPGDVGREVIIRYDSSLRTNNKFYTDSNGREMMQRILNKQPTWDLNVTEPVAGNYYPVNTRATLVDEDRAVQLTVLTDRSHGGASLDQGQMELMVHRRLLVDDERGVNEPLNETQNGHGLIVKGRHWIYYSKFESMDRSRILAQEMFYKPTVAIGADIMAPKYPSRGYSDSAVNNEYVNVLTVINVDYSGDVFTYLLRLENILPSNEGGSPLSVNLDRVFKDKTLVQFSEKGLAGDRPISHVRGELNHSTHDKGTVIVLQPLQIRTFFATYKPSVIVQI